MSRSWRGSWRERSEPIVRPKHGFREPKLVHDARIDEVLLQGVNWLVWKLTGIMCFVASLSAARAASHNSANCQQPGKATVNAELHWLDLERPRTRLSYVNLDGIFARFGDANRCFTFPANAGLRELVEQQFFKVSRPDKIYSEITRFIWLH